MSKIKIPVEVSARHLHISKKDFEKLFGKREKLNPVRELSQPGEFASDKFVTLINDKNKIENVRILGPFRKNSQVEISMTDAYNLKLNPFPKLRISGDLEDVTKINVKGPKANIKIPCIIAKRHLHLSKKDATKINLKDKEKLKVRVLTQQRHLIFEDVIARVSQNYNTSLHLDTDEANAAGINKKTFAEIIKNEK